MTEQVFVGSVFLAGIFSFFSPCILPLLPVYIAQLGGTAPGDRNKAVMFGRLRLHPALIGNTMFFVLGVSFVFVLLGFGAGALGNVINASWFMRACGLLVIAFGIFQTGVIRLPFLQRERRWSVDWSGKKGFAASLLLGFTFSFGWTPCIGPVLTAVLSLSAGEGSAWQGGGYMIVYALGLAIPFLILALCSDLLLGRLRRLNRYTTAVKIVSGILLIVMGALLMTNDLDRIVTAI
ncbi:sulfite exporter TauE/SafE family protein [Cohnella sp. CBP 2801]|uniref:Sulfite exporter TauE/SafE family protein n=1 Tax=Cohnella zeiphila TaxID=2761120 RepID=A0A7X0SSV5_9BACL|nr:sulfite exporter TauE/SafE family protein [Cohnella zeiphila]